MQKRLDALIEATITGLGYILWGYEYRAHQESALLRVFIDAEQGITVDDCSKVSLQLGAALDVEDIIPVAYILEVSSPGVDRVLFIPEHYASYIGEKLKIRTRTPIEGRRNFVGILEQCDMTAVTVEVEGNRYVIPYDVIDRGRLVYEMKAQPKGKGKRTHE
ncbi:ribosome maturation factor RimP [Thiofilum flexile]|uniref:ribosome maturation factor RimP n=1 Tax=Thiofilum flexile TaxID=125627 RepID=UPI00038147F4|nr:ribosome maturation factor RimP [Thiofilum flexile]